jgi:hypothetical protein
MLLDLHRIVKHATDTDQIWSGKTIEQKGSRSDDHPVIGLRSLAAMPQMIAADILAKLWTFNAAGAFGITGDIVQGRDQQPFVAPASDFAEVLLRR